jgi:hypothetical protein
VENCLSVRGVEFTDHAMRKFEILKRSGLSLSIKQVVKGCGESREGRCWLEG